MATIAVVGGGLAGLACAWRLTRQGHRVRVLERAREVGGRARSERRGRYRLDTGLPVVLPGQRRVLALAREAGVLGSLRPLAFGRDVQLPDPGSGASARDWRHWVGGSRGQRDAWRAVLDFQRPTRLFDPAGGAARDPGRVVRSAAADALGWWPAPPTGAEDGAAPPRLQLPLTAPHAFAGGMGVLAEGLARHLDVATGCEVERIESDSEGVRIVYRLAGGDRCDHVDAAVVAVPAPRVAGLCPKLTPEERGFFELACSLPGVVAHLFYERAPQLGARSVVFPRAGGLELSSLHAEHARPGGVPHGAGLLRAQLAPAAAARMFRAADASIADLVLENLAYAPAVGPVLRARQPFDYAVWRHADMAPRFDADHARRLARFVTRLERSPRLAFAGDFLAGPSADGAVASGLHAAREIGERLRG